MTREEAIQEWKKLGIVNAEFEFCCGGDSMNDTTINFYNDKNGFVKSDNLETYFDNQVYKNVTFYEASDGHYIGESGVVTIQLDTESDDEADHDFTYSKSAQAEYNESYTEIIDVKLTAEQKKFIELNVSNINGGDGDRTTINYKRDFIMTDDDERIFNEIAELVDDEAEKHPFEDVSGEPSDWFNYTTNSGEGGRNNLQELTIKGNCLKLEVSRTFIVYSDSEW